MIIKGKLVSGTGRGSKFIAMPVYFEIFEQELNAEPFCGTLNLKLEDGIIEKVADKFENGKDYSNLVTQEGNVTGGIIVIELHLRNKGEQIKGVGVRPKLTSHDQTILEVVAKRNIRETWDLKDGEEIDIVL